MGFIETRRALVFKDGAVYIQPDHDKRRGKAWCLETLHMSELEWKEAVRGYMTSSRVVFFKGEEYAPVLDILPEQMIAAKEAHRREYGTSVPPDVFTGVKPSEPNTEWNVLYHYSPRNGNWERMW